MCSYGARKKFDQDGYIKIFDNQDYMEKIGKKNIKSLKVKRKRLKKPKTVSMSSRQYLT